MALNITPKKTKHGFVYVLVILGHENVYKVGCTTDIDLRKKQYSVCILEPEFIFVSEISCDHKKLEKLVHQQLNAYRINPIREFFKCSIDNIIETIKQCVESINMEQEDKQQ